jgi:hypothetical protein
MKLIHHVRFVRKQQDIKVKIQCRVEFLVEKESLLHSKYFERLSCQL